MKNKVWTEVTDWLNESRMERLKHIKWLQSKLGNITDSDAAGMASIPSELYCLAEVMTTIEVFREPRVVPAI